jgi:hypothetical protein
VRSVLEKRIEEKVVKWATEKGAICLKLNLWGSTGWPDREFLYAGRVAFIEFKAPGQKPARNQPARIHKLQSHMFLVGVYDDPAAAIAFLEAALFSSSSSEIGSFSSMSGAALPCGGGQDVDNVCNPVNPKAEKAD